MAAGRIQAPGSAQCLSLDPHQEGISALSAPGLPPPGLAHVLVSACCAVSTWSKAHVYLLPEAGGLGVRVHIRRLQG